MKRNKFILIAKTKDFELEQGQSPRGLRDKEHRPHLLTIEVKNTMNRAELSKFIKYLIELESAMGF